MQNVPMETPVLPQLPYSEMVIYDVPKEKYYEVFPLPANYQKADYVEYEIYPISEGRLCTL